MSWPDPERRQVLIRLYWQRETFREIARQYGGTPQGVRSTVRKMIERGELVRRPQPQRIPDIAERGRFQ